jgi:hypothetical protein
MAVMVKKQAVKSRCLAVAVLAAGASMGMIFVRLFMMLAELG